MDALKPREYEVKVTYTLSEQDMEDIIVTALEGGIGYWACLDNSIVEPPEWGDWSKKPVDVPTAEYAWQILRDGGTLHFLDEEDDDAEYFMCAEDFFKGIGLCIRHKHWDGDMDTLDALVADMIIQYAVFGEVIYG